MGNIAEDIREKIPVPEPTLVVAPSESMAKNMAAVPPKPTLKPANLILLVAVFAIVSILIGILIWILHYELTKNRNKPQVYRILNYELGSRNYG